MEKNILNEITRLQDLMGINTKPLINEKKNTEKKLISEISLKPKLNFPDVKSFDKFRKKSTFKTISGLLDFDFNNLKGFTTIPQNIDGLTKHLTDFKPIWVASLVDNGDTIENATGSINSTISKLTKIKNKSLKKNLAEFVPGKNYRFYETIPEEGGLRNAVLHQYKDTYGIKTWDEFKVKLGKSADELKQLDADVNAVSDAIKNATVPKVKGGSTPKPKGGSTPKPKYKKGTIGSKITSETDPKTGNPYDIEYVMKEFGSNRTEADNTKLGLAWDDGWRPGGTIKPEFKPTGPYKKIIKKGASKETPKIDLTLQELINKTNLENDPSGRKSLYTEEKAYKQFGADEDNPAHVEKLKSAWAAGWRPGKPIDDYPEFIIKDSTQNINKMMKDNPNKLPGDPTELTSELEKSFGIDPGKPRDYELFYDAWKNGEWRPFNKKGYEIPVPEKYRTELYIARQNPEKYGIPNKIFQDSPGSPGFRQRVTNLIKLIWYNQASFWEDVLTKSQPKSSEDAFNKIIDNSKTAINEWFASSKASDFGMLREKFLKLQRDNKFAAQIAEKEGLSDLMEKMKQGLFVAIDNEKGLDDVARTAHKKSISEFFVEFEKNITDFKSAEKEFAKIGVGKNALQKWNARFWAPLKSGEGKAAWWKSLAKLAYQRIGNLLRNGQFFTNAENLMIRSINKYTPREAWKNAIGRIIMGKVVLPITYFSLKGVLVVGIFRNVSSEEGVDMTDEESIFKYIWDDYMDYLFVSKDGDIGSKEFILEGLRTVTPGELADWAIEFGYGASQDPFNTFYRIEYKTYENNVWSNSKYYPENKETKVTFDKIENHIKSLKKQHEKGVKICDVTSYTNKKENKEKLKEVIGANLNSECGGNKKLDVYKIKYYWELVKQWVPIPKLEYYTSEKISAEISQLIKENPNVKICDVSDKKTDTYTSNPLKIPPNNVGDCSKDKKEEPKKEETTVTPEQTVEYLKYVANRDLGISNTAEYTSFTEYGIKYNNNPVWGRTIGNMIFLLSIDGNNKLYKKEYPRSKYKDGRTAEEQVSDMSNPSGWELVTEKISESTIKKIIKNILSSNMEIRKRRIFEQEDEKRFGENKYDHLYDAFTFEKYDDKTGEFKEIETDSLKHGKIKERFNDFIKRYDTDDAFVRAVVDTHEDIARIKYLKDQANISEAYLATGLALVLNAIRESRGEYEIFSVSRSNGNWHLVKGDFNQKEMSKMKLTKQIPPEKQPKKKENGVESLKKKELTGITLLNQDEKKGLGELPMQIKRKVLEKLRSGWVTEKPYEFLKEFYSVSDINSVFNDKIKIYKLNPTKEFFESLSQNSPRVFIRKGFCKSLNVIKNTKISSESGEKVFKHILDKCQTKFKGEYGVTQINKYL